MTSGQLYRISGLALVVGAIVFIIHIVARSLITAGADPVSYAPSSLWVLINLLGLVGAVLLLFGLPAMYARIALPSGLPGLIGVVLIALAWLFFSVFLSFYSAFVLPWLAVQSPALVAASAPPPPGIIVTFLIALVAELIGAVLFALPFLRGHIRPRWVGFILPAAVLVAVVGDLLAPSGPAANVVVNLLSNMGPILFVIPLGYLGWRMWSNYAPSAQIKPEADLSPS